MQSGLGKGERCLALFLQNDACIPVMAQALVQLLGGDVRAWPGPCMGLVGIIHGVLVVSGGDVLGDGVGDGGDVVEQANEFTRAVSRSAAEGGAHVGREDGGGHVRGGRGQDLSGWVKH